MRFSTALVVLLYVAVAVRAKSSSSPTLTYWHRKLPWTPIPDALRELISPLSPQKTSELLDAIREDKKVSLGEPKFGTTTDDFDNTFNYFSGYTLSYFHYGAGVHDDDAIANTSLSGLFFLDKDLHTGKKMTLYSRLLQRPSPDSRIFFLPRRLAEAIPFSSDKLSVALQMLDISRGSHLALAMKNTLELCESPANSGENSYCATSLESMIDYATSRLGSSRVNLLDTNVPFKAESQQYTITGLPFQSKSDLRSVVCHGQAYAYAVYYCHETQHTTTARVSLKGEDGCSGEGVGVCHTDTSGWSPQHVAFKVLNVKPGGAPVCHFLPDGHVLWLPAN